MQIKTCPFCKSEVSNVGAKHCMPRGYKWCVFCINCEAMGPAFWQKDETITDDAAYDKAVELWNGGR